MSGRVQLVRSRVRREESSSGTFYLLATRTFYTRRLTFLLLRTKGGLFGLEGGGRAPPLKRRKKKELISRLPGLP